MKALTSNPPMITETATMAINAIGLILLLGFDILVEKVTLPDSDSKFCHRIEVKKIENIGYALKI